jgi:hypothetical protein
LKFFKKASNACKKYEVENCQLIKSSGWVGGWWVGGWVEVKVVLWIAYSNKNSVTLVFKVYHFIQKLFY